MEHFAFEGARIFHADHHRGEQAFKHPRWREVVGGADFFQVDGDGGARLGAVHHVAGHQPLRVAEDVLANPGGWQVSQHLVFFGELVKARAHRGAVDQRVVRVHHALGVAGGAAGEKHGRHVVGLGHVHLFAKQLGVDLGVGHAGSHQFFQGAQAGFVVLAQAARVVVVHMRKLRAAVANLQHLVDLLLVFHHSKPDVGVVDGKHALGAHGILVKRHRNGANRLRGQHGGVQTGAVGADHHHMFAALQAGLVQAAGNGFHQLGHGSPAGGLPDAVFLFAHGWRVGAALRVVQQQPGESVLHGNVSWSLGTGPEHLWINSATPRSNHSGADVRLVFDVMLSVRRQFRVFLPRTFPSAF